MINIILFFILFIFTIPKVHTINVAYSINYSLPHVITIYSQAKIQFSERICKLCCNKKRTANERTPVRLFACKLGFEVYYIYNTYYIYNKNFSHKSIPSTVRLFVRSVFGFQRGNRPC